MGAVYEDPLRAWLGGHAELDLGVDLSQLAASPREQLVLKRLPVGGVVDVVGKVSVGVAEAPAPLGLDDARGADGAGARARGARRPIAVDRELSLGQRAREPAGGVEVNPEGDGFDRAAAPPSGRQRPSCAAPPTCGRCRCRRCAPRSARRSAGSASTRIRVRRRTQSGAARRPASSTSEKATSCSQRAIASSRTRPVGAQSPSSGRRGIVKTRPSGGASTIGSGWCAVAWQVPRRWNLDGSSVLSHGDNATAGVSRRNQISRVATASPCAGATWTRSATSTRPPTTSCSRRRGRR